jgi:hypothetical protein
VYSPRLWLRGDRGKIVAKQERPIDNSSDTGTIDSVREFCNRIELARPVSVEDSSSRPT